MKRTYQTTVFIALTTVLITLSSSITKGMVVAQPNVNTRDSKQQVAPNVVKILQTNPRKTLQAIELKDLLKSTQEYSDVLPQVLRKNRPISKQLAQKLQATVEKIVEETRIPGVTVAIIAPRGSWFGASGFSDLKNQVAMNPRDRFNIASISKTFTATTVLSLVDEGKLNLEDNLTQWLPASVVDNIPNSQDITIRQLLNHTSGIPDYSENPLILNNPLALYSRDWSQEELIALVNELPPKNQPGQGWFYSATNYLLLAMIVESATDSTFASQVRARIIEPLNLKNTFVPPQEPVPADLVSGYLPATQEQINKLEPSVREFLENNIDYVEDDQNRKLYDAKSLPRRSGGYGSGSVISSAPDTAKFAQALFRGQLLKPETLQQMGDFIPDPKGGFKLGDVTYTGYGLGLENLELPSPLNQAWGHNGQNPGYVTQMWYLKEHDITAVALVNERNNYLELDPNKAEPTSQLARDKILLEALKLVLEE